MPFTGRVIQEQKNYYVVNTERGTIRATLKGVLKKDRKRICTGDRVDVERINNDSDEGLITHLHERTSFLKRPPLANIDQIMVVCTVKEPPLDLEALDRLLLCIGAYGLTALIVFNKNDLLTSDDTASLREVTDAYRTIGYEVMLTSAIEETGLKDLSAVCNNKVSAMAGLSGVGKSALLSRLIPGHEFRLGDVSGPTGRGTHTTTTVSLLPLPCGGYIADTPGLAFVDIPKIPEEDVATYFPELERLIGECRFNNCIHDNEPGCKVQELVEKGDIKDWRVNHYLKIFHEMQDRRRAYREK
jgi:ribosome biogenesis GTPase / thiamine phosphate phosphatase